VQLRTCASRGNFFAKFFGERCKKNSKNARRNVCSLCFQQSVGNFRARSGKCTLVSFLCFFSRRDTLSNATLRRMVHGTCATEGAGSKTLYNLIDSCVTLQCRALKPQTQPTIAQLVALVTAIETGPAAFLDKWFNYLVWCARSAFLARRLTRLRNRTALG